MAAVLRDRWIKVVSTALLLIASPCESHADPLFGSPFLFFSAWTASSGNFWSTRSVKIGDVDLDGNSDLIVGLSNAVILYSGIGDGTFAPPRLIKSGGGGAAIALADLNADGKLDVANQWGDTLSVSLGNGDGTFGPQSLYSGGAPSFSLSLSVADLNADGALDLAAGSGGQVIVFLGNGDGTFGQGDEFATGADGDIAVGDVSGDGRADIVAPSYNTDSIVVLLGNGDGSFGAAAELPTGNNPWFVAVEDLNSDGINDIAVANDGSLAGGVSISLATGAGSFAPPITFSSGHGGSFARITAGDLNSDQKVDLVISDLADAVSVFLGNNDGTFLSYGKYLAGDGVAGAAIGDLNTDGVPDLAAAAFDYKGVSVLLGNGDGTLSGGLPGPTGFGTGLEPVSATVAELNADGNADVIVANEGSNTISVLLGNGDLTFGGKSDFGAGSLPRSLAVANLDAGSQPDLVVTNMGSNLISVLLGNPDGTFRPRVIYLTGTSPVYVAVGDVNLDGMSDVVTADSSVSAVSVLYNDGSAGFNSRVAFPTGPGPNGVAIGDLNIDGTPDLVVSNGGSTTVSILLGTGSGGFGVRTDIEIGPYPWAVAIADMNADGKSDLVTTFARRLAVLLGNGDGTFGPMAEYVVVTGSKPIQIVDLNSDGVLDVAVASGRVVTVLLGSGDGTLGPPVGYGTWDIAAISAAPANLNGDGRPDLVIVSKYLSSVTVLPNLGPGTPTSISLVMLDARAEEGRVRITWYVPDSRHHIFTVERRTREGDWVPVANPTADQERRILFEDADVTPGETYGYRLLLQEGGVVERSSEVWVLVPVAEGAPMALRLEPGRPNPSPGRTQFRYGLPKAGRVRLAVFDAAGRLVTTVVDKVESAGWGSAAWDGTDAQHRPVASGVYFGRLEADGRVQVRKIALAR